MKCFVIWQSNNVYGKRNRTKYERLFDSVLYFIYHVYRKQAVSDKNMETLLYRKSQSIERIAHDKTVGIFCNVIISFDWIAYGLRPE